MRIRRAIVGLTTVMAAVLGLSLATADPAAAAGAGVWRAYGNTNPITSSSSTWRCGSTEALATNVGAQVCAIRARDGVTVQVALIVRNNRSSLYAVEGHVDMYTETGFDDLWSCPLSGVAPNSWSVCFGASVLRGRPIRAEASVQGNVYLNSPYV